MSVITTTANITDQIASVIRQRLNIANDKLRSDALSTFEALGLPYPKHEEFKYTPITRLLEKNFSFAPSDAPGPLTEIQQFFIQGIDATVLVFIDGVYSKDHSKVLASENELKVIPLEDALGNRNELAVKHFAKYVNIKTDALAAWNTAAWNHGLLLHVPDKAIVQKPIVVYHIANATAGEIIAINRNLLVAGKDSEATIIEKFDSQGSANHFLNIVSEAVLQPNARLNLFKIQNDSGNRYQYDLTEVYQHSTSLLNTYTFSLQGKLLRNNLHLQLDGEGVESHMYGLYLLDKDTIADNHTVADHKKPNSFSNELYKGIMDDHARGVFNGKIFVRPNAQKTNAFQANRNILLSDSATVNTKPQLEIWADDVKCSHGCTTGQLDEEALFYLQSRGINKDTARAMMLYAFAGEVLDKINNPVLHQYLDSLVSDRLHKNF